MTLEEIALAVGARVSPDEGRLPVTGVSTDTRKIAAGDLFVALDGPNRHGSDFIGEAFRAGAVAAISPRAVDAAGPVLVVASADQALLDLGAEVRNRLRIPVIGITGTNGKTTTKDCIAALLGTRFKVVAATGSFNNKIGVPLTICRADHDTEVLVLEIGTNSPGEIKTLAAVARPTIAVLTSIGPGHLQGLAGVGGVLSEKLSLLECVEPGGWAFLNGDDERLAHAELPAGARLGKVVRYGVSPECTFRPLEATLDDQGVGFRLSPRGPMIRARLRGRKNLGNLAGAVAVARAFGLDDHALVYGAAGIQPPKMRMETRRIAGMEVVFDCYNANPASMTAALDEWCGRPAVGRRVAILGDMLELGDESAHYHRELGRRLATLPIAVIVLVGEAVAHAHDACLEMGVPADRIRRFANCAAARSSVDALLRPGDDVLLKGSRGIGLERLFDRPQAAEVARA